MGVQVGLKKTTKFEEVENIIYQRTLTDDKVEETGEISLRNVKGGHIEERLDEILKSKQLSRLSKISYTKEF